MISTARISYITGRIQEVWEKSPDLYFTQFIGIIEEKAVEMFRVKELYELEDEDLLKILALIEDELEKRSRYDE